MVVLIANFMYKVIHAIYRFQKQIVMNGWYRHASKAHWKNKYPIVLVAGYLGSAQDQSWLMGNYFYYALRSA